MHSIDNPGLRLPNGLDAADADGDGLPDLLTNYEWSGSLRIAFRPPAADARLPWEAITIGRVANAESSAFGDVDLDGDPDVVVAHGAEALARPGVAVLLNPGGSRARDPRAWTGPHPVPAGSGLGHLHYVRCRDLDGDGRLEIVVGGRGRAKRPGIRILLPPARPAPAGDLRAWSAAVVDAGIESGHGFVFADLDGDGDEDIALANSDWDTEPREQVVAWHENPGPGALRAGGAWTRHILYRSADFYTKEQVAAADVDGDARLDLVVHLENALYLFRNGGRDPADPTGPPRFTRIVIPKPAEVRWRSRMIRLADIDGDGDLEVAGGLIHRSGSLPPAKAALFWMDVDWKAPWLPAPARAVKWGSGFRGSGPLNGEKWDQAVLDDFDADGDLDIAADCEEFHSPVRVHIAVAWFENPAR